MVASRVHGEPSDLSAAPGAGGIQLPQGNYELAMRFDIPRAQIVDWKIVCPGADVVGQVGETFEQYRERRIDEMLRERDRERERVATATSIVVGAVAPRVQGTARVGNSNVHARAHVDAHAAGVATAHGAIPDAPIELAPGDIGRGTLTSTARVMTGGDGVCALQVTADDPDVRAAFTVTRIRDLEAEDRMRTIAAREVAVKARGELSAQLVTAGADPSIRQRRIEADAKARFEARAAVEARARLKADLRARWEATAIYARQEYLAYLSGKCNAEPGHRERVAEQERVRAEARLNADAEIAQRRDQLALRARSDLRAQLLAFGAKARPPRPEPKPENPGPAPFDGAQWTAGYWGWVGGSWEWQDGGWSDPSTFGESGEVDRTIGVGVGIHVTPTYTDHTRRTYETGTRDHRSKRDHVRDSRDNDDPPSRPTWDTKRDEPKVRDHRDSSRPSWEAKDHDKGGTRVRDHRDKDDDKKKDDDKPIVRDHRR